MTLETKLTIFGRILRFLRDDCPENPRTIVLWVASGALICALVATTRACSKWILYHGDLGAGACWAFGSSIAGLMFLAGYAVGFPKAFVPGSTSTTSETVSTPVLNKETTTTVVTDPSPISPAGGSLPTGGQAPGCAGSALPVDGSNQ